MDSRPESHEGPWAEDGGTAWGSSGSAPEMGIVRGGGTGGIMHNKYGIDEPFLDMSSHDLPSAAATEAPPITRLGTGDTAPSDSDSGAPLITRSETSKYRWHPDEQRPTDASDAPPHATYHVRGDARATTETVADNTMVYQGEIVDGGSSIPFDNILGLQPKVALFGDKVGVAKAVFETVNTRAENNAGKEEPIAIVAVRFGPETPSYLADADAASPELYTAVKASAGSETGLFGALSGPQKAEVIADAAADDAAAANAYEHILGTVIREVEKKTGEPATLPQIRDFVRHLREARNDLEHGEMPTIQGKGGQHIRLTLDDALWKKSREANEGYFEPLGQWLDKAASGDTAAAPQEPEAEPNGHRPNVTVLDVGMQGHKRGLRAQSDLAANALLALVAENGSDKTTPWGKIGAVALVDADLGDPRTIAEILLHCKGKIPSIVSVDQLNNDTANLVRGSDMYCVAMPADPGDVAMLSSLLPTTLRDDVTGESHSEHANVGQSRNNSVNFGYEADSDSEKSGGRSHTRDRSKGETYDRSQSRTIGEGPTLLPREINDSIGPGELGLIQRDGTPRGVYDVNSRGLVAERQFPPAPPEKLDVGEKIEGIRSGQGQTAIGTGKEGDPSFDDLAAQRLPFSLQQELEKLQQRKLEQPWAEKQRYQKEFTKAREAEGKSAGASVRGIFGATVVKHTAFPRWLKQRYILEHQLAKQKYDELVAAAQTEYSRPLNIQEQVRIWRTIADGEDQENRSLGSLNWNDQMQFERDFTAWRQRRGV